MSNNFSSNPIILDTFTSAIDVGNSVYGNPKAMFKLQSIEWQTPSTIDHTAVVTDGAGNVIFSETCTVAKQSIIKYFDGLWVDGLKVAESGVGSGKIVIVHM